MGLNWHVYVLYLEKNKWYVGIAKDVEERYREHKEGRNASAWTRKYKPLRIVYNYNTGKRSKTKAENQETKTTIALMKQYGINNVRGGRLAMLEQEEVEFWLGEVLCKKIHHESSMCKHGIFDELVKNEAAYATPSRKNSIFSRGEQIDDIPMGYGPIYKIYKNKIFIVFKSYPGRKKCDELIENGWSYDGLRRCWLNDYDSEAIAYASSFCVYADASNNFDSDDYLDDEDNEFDDGLEDEDEDIGDLDNEDDDFNEEDFDEDAEYKINTEKRRIEIYFNCEEGYSPIDYFLNKVRTQGFHFCYSKNGSFWWRKYTKNSIDDIEKIANDICTEFNNYDGADDDVYNDSLPFN